MSDTPRRWPAWATRALLSIAFVLFAIAVGWYAAAGAPGGPGAAMMPRMPPPPADLPTLLFQLGVGSVVWYVAAVSLPLILIGARVVDVERLGAFRTAGIAIGAALVLFIATSAIDYLWTYGRASVRPDVAGYMSVSLRRHVLPVIALVGVAATVEIRRRALQTAFERERLRAEVARQRLIALTNQLRPHFLFNTLQAISTLIHRDPNAADEMLTKLSELLSDALRHRESPFVPLEDEVRYTRTWLDIATVRFGERLAFEIDVPADLNHLLVPLFILQPAVENALTHGVGGLLRGGRVTVRARQAGTQLRLEVIDDGAGIQKAAHRRGGIGLQNTRERLQAAFGAEQSLVCEPGASGGTVVMIELPARAGAPA